MALNAVAACPTGGEVVLEVSPSGDGVAIRVRDNGSGIAKEDLPHVFDPFFTRRDTGTGLAAGSKRGNGDGATGLANVRSRLRALYGEAATLTLEEAREGGTRVRLSLPLP